jgi:hypothetical protein
LIIERPFHQKIQAGTYDKNANFPSSLYDPMAENEIAICSKLMADKGPTIAFAESATAGWLCSICTD